MLPAFFLAIGWGCDDSSKLDAAACDALASKAFDLLNDRHLCSTDVDCMVCEWPDATRAISKGDMDKIRPLKKEFEDGKCTHDLKPPATPPEVYCKQGLCVVRHKAADAGAD